jgi:hypothetical protein
VRTAIGPGLPSLSAHLPCFVHNYLALVLVDFLPTWQMACTTCLVVNISSVSSHHKNIGR